MFGFLKQSKAFAPSFPIIDLEASQEEVRAALSDFGAVQTEEPKEHGDETTILVAESSDTRISVGFNDVGITYVNYLSEQSNRSDKQKASKFAWFINYYGGAKDFSKPMNTGYMVMAHNEKRGLSVVLGLHMGPIRINKHPKEAE